jgi:hypothetical protein
MRSYTTPVHTLFVKTSDELPFAEHVAHALTEHCQIPCRAQPVEGEPPAGEVCLVHRGTSVKRKKTCADITMRFDVFGGAKRMPVKIVLGVGNPDERVDDPMVQHALASSVANHIRAIFDERDMPARKDVVIYSLWCGAPFAEKLARGLEAAGYACTIRPEHPNTYDHLPRAWGRVRPGGILVGDEIRVRTVTVMLGERGEDLGLLKLKVGPGGDPEAALSAMADKMVGRIEKLIAEQRA